MECIELIFDGIRTLAICTGAAAAWVGLNAWRDQLIGSNDYVLAKRLLTLVFELQGIIRSLRSSFEPDESRLWVKLLEVGAEIDTAFVEARAHWGDSIIEHKKALLGCTNQLQLSDGYSNHCLAHSRRCYGTIDCDVYSVDSR